MAGHPQVPGGIGSVTNLLGRAPGHIGADDLISVMLWRAEEVYDIEGNPTANPIFR